VGEELKLKTLGVLGRRAHEGLHVVGAIVALPKLIIKYNNALGGREGRCQLYTMEIYVSNN
jgi:hypothetical protein